MQSFAIAVLALGVIALMIWRQLRWRRFDATRALRLPVVLAAIGLLEIANTTSGARIGSADVLVLAVELAASIGVGAGMGVLTVFRPSREEPGAWESRTGWAGAALWFVLVAVRIGASVVGPHLGAHAATSSGMILLVLAVARGTTALVARSREPQRSLVSA